MFYGVRTTRIYCRAGCPSRAPRPENVELFDTTADAQRSGYRACKRCKPGSASRSELAVATALAFIEENLDGDLSLPRLAAHVGMSPTHFQRVFVKTVGASPKVYVATQRTVRAKGLLAEKRTVLNSAHDAGFAGVKPVYRYARAALGMTPGQYRRGGSGQEIAYIYGRSTLGTVLVAVTAKGVAAVTIGANRAQLLDELRTEFPRAEIKAAASVAAALREAAERALAAVVAAMNGTPNAAMPLDVSGTPFQLQVWRAIARVPAGVTRTYAQIAKDIGAPGAARAVARACASNRIAVVIPCHRIVRTDGSLSGYRWGEERKRRLLELEREAARD